MMGDHINSGKGHCLWLFVVWANNAVPLYKQQELFLQWFYRCLHKGAWGVPHALQVTRRSLCRAYAAVLILSPLLKPPRGFLPACGPRDT